MTMTVRTMIKMTSGDKHNNNNFITIFQQKLYSSPNIVRVIKSRRMRWAGHVARMGKVRGVYRVLVGKPEGERPLGRSRCSWEDNIKVNV
jgi:hypothetical protein